MAIQWIKEFSLIPCCESLMFEISHGSFLRQPLFRHLMTSLQRSVIFLQKLCFSCPWLANSLMPSYFSCQWFFDAEFLNLRVNIDRFGLRVCAVAHIQSLTVIDVRGVLNVYCARFNCSYALMHLCPLYIGSTALKVHCDGKYQKGWKKKTSAAVLEFGRLSHYCHTYTHTHTYTLKYVEIFFKSGLKWVEMSM